MGVDDIGQTFEQTLQSQRKVVARVLAGHQQIDRRMEDVRDPAAGVDINDAHTGALRTGIDAEDACHCFALGGCAQAYASAPSSALE